MRKQTKLLLYAGIALALPGTLAITSCKKKESVEKSPVEQSFVVSIADLKGFMAELINVKAENISYNETKEKFSVFGIEQITRAELTKYYFNLKN